LTSPALRPVFFNRLLVGGLLLATEPQLAVLLLGQLKFAPWQYTLAFGAPCIGGFIGSRLARPLVTRLGRHRVLLAVGTLSACWPIGLAFVGPGMGGVVLVIGVQFGLVFFMGMYNPVVATYRLDHTGKHLIARMLLAWSTSTTLATAALTAVWGLLASLTSPRVSIAVAGILMLATPLLLPRREQAPEPAPVAVPTPVSMPGLWANFPLPGGQWRPRGEEGGHGVGNAQAAARGRRPRTMARPVRRQRGRPDRRLH
jgi:MFS family permease